MDSVVAVFREPAQAKSALEALLAQGFERKHLAFSMLDNVAELEIASDTGVSPEEGAPAGSGGVLRGMLTGAAAGLGLTIPIWLLLLAFPETRVFHVGGLYGMLFGFLGGLGMGGFFGTLTGSDNGDYVTLLRQLGLPGPAAERMVGALNDGNVLVIARDQEGEKADAALQVMQKAGALRMDDASGGGRLGSERKMN